MKPKIEILLEVCFNGNDISARDAIDYLEYTHDTVQKHPDSCCSTLDIGDFTYYVIYRKLEGVKRITKKDIRHAMESEDDRNVLCIG